MPQRVPFMFLMFVAVAALLAQVGCQSKSPETTEQTAEALPDDAQLKQMIDDVLRFTYTERSLNLSDHAAWQILHGALPFGMRFKVYNGDQRVSALQWVLDGNQMKGWTVQHGEKELAHSRRGLKMILESGTKTGQGHEDQWLAIMAQSGLTKDQKIIFQGQEYKVEDVIQQSMWDVYRGKECSWTLIALMNYLDDIDMKWKSSDGEEWTIEQLIGMEAKQDINMSACGGTHRLIGMTMALNAYEKQGREVQGGWLDAQKTVADAIEKARLHQQPDGSFSTNYFLRPGSSPDLALRINTTGHTLEFLALALDDEQLMEPWVTRAVVQLCKLFQSTKNIDLECGSLYHATHGLLEYYERRFGPWQYPDQDTAETTPGTGTDEDSAGGELAKKAPEPSQGG